MKRSIFVFLLAMPATLLSRLLPAQTPNLPAVTVTQRNLPELRKIHTVIVVNGALGAHPDPDMDPRRNMDFFRAVTKQVEKLTCFKVAFKAPPSASRTPGDGYAVLTTSVDQQFVSGAIGILYSVSVVSKGHTLWDGGMLIYAHDTREMAMPPGAVVDTLKALAKDACPGQVPVE